MKQQRIDINKFKSAPVKPRSTKRSFESRWSDPPGFLLESPGLPQGQSFRVRGTFIEDIAEEVKRPQRRSKSAELPVKEDHEGKEYEPVQDLFSFERKYVRELSDKLNTLWNVDSTTVESATPAGTEEHVVVPEEKVTSHSAQVAVVVHRLQSEFFESEKSTRLGREFFESEKGNRLKRNIFESRKSSSPEHDNQNPQTMGGTDHLPTKFDSTSTRVTCCDPPIYDSEATARSTFDSQKTAGWFDSQKTAGRFDSPRSTTRFDSRSSIRRKFDSTKKQAPCSEAGNLDKYNRRVQMLWDALDEGSDSDDFFPPRPSQPREEIALAPRSTPSHTPSQAPLPSQFDVLPRMQPTSHAGTRAQTLLASQPEVPCPPFRNVPTAMPLMTQQPLQVEAIPAAKPVSHPIRSAAPQLPLHTLYQPPQLGEPVMVAGIPQQGPYTTVPNFASLSRLGLTKEIPQAFATVQAPAQMPPSAYGQMPQVVPNLLRDARRDFSTSATNQNLAMNTQPENTGGWQASVAHLASHGVTVPAPGLSKQGSGEWPADEAANFCSLGSVGHPHLCMRPCAWFAAGKCPNGVSCGFCHLDHPTRPMHLDKRNREKLKSLSYSECVYMLEPILREKASAAGIESVAVDLFAVLLASAELADSAVGLPQRQGELNTKQMQSLLRPLSAMNFMSLLMVVMNRPDAPPMMTSEATLKMIERARMYQK